MEPSDLENITVDTRDRDVTSDESIIKEAQRRFYEIYTKEEDNRTEARSDLRMLAGKDHWPSEVIRQREIEQRPVLTINKLPSFSDRVTNEGRMNRIAIKVRPNGGGATKELAETFNGIIRNIENDSNASDEYQIGFEGAVNNGFGFLTVSTQYASDDTFDQVIKIKGVKNPLSTFLDEDRNFGIQITKISRKEMKARYGVEVSPFSASLSQEAKLWVEEDSVAIAKYWTKEPDRKTLHLLSDGRVVDAEDWGKIADETAEAEQAAASEYAEMVQSSPEMAAQMPPPPAPITIMRSREVRTHKIMHYLIGGDKIISRTEWAGKYIPIVKVRGKEIVVDDQIYSRGIIRFAKDPQRMYNYFRSAATETVGLAPKAPYMVEERQIEGFEEDWSSIGRRNLPYLKYKAVANAPAPARQIVTQTAIGEITESNLSNDEMKATTGIFDASLGATSNEVSGKAILARAGQGDLSNYGYYDNLKIAVKEIGDILVDLIPRIYDTERQVMTTDEVDRDKMVTVNQVILDDESGEQVIINDLSQGRYKVVVTAGPSYSTKRIEAANSMLDFVRTAPETAQFVMDLVVENQDWPGAAKIANRLRKLLPPGIDDEGPMQPQPPGIDEIVKRLKANSIELGNVKKKLDIVEQRRDLDGRDQQAAEAGAAGALETVFGGGGGK